MCDEITAKEEEEYLARTGQLTRRQFGKLSAGAGLAMMLPKVANAVGVIGRDVNVTTPDGVSDCYFVHPTSGKAPGILMWPDIFGLRPAFKTMATRLAESGYSVLVVNPYYRKEKAPVVPEGASFSDTGVRDKLVSLMQSMTPEVVTKDALAYVGFLDQQEVVDKDRKLGTTGYCMGGPFTMRTAAALPDRIGAGASFHGARLAYDGPDSPHLLVPKMKAQFLFAIAESDDKNDPKAKELLREAYDKAGLPAEIEVYKGTMHGWCAIDSRVYNQEQAERAWGRLLVLLKKALA